ncbi:permease-like cell division protein FtsX [Peptoniphilus obesi]|uniref:permease-like cell division protein FtsX n=1 Tax=Peptoniphilus obesi TaxID=1472765 RepID=UPI0004AC760F|nr:permease-like cell division protein FtsX [Peptoniphilus obesi]
MKIIRQIINVIKEAFLGIFRNSGMSLISIVSIGSMLTLFGFVFILVLGINSTVYRLGDELDKVVVYLEDNVSADQVNDLIDVLANDKRVKEVNYTSKQEALEIFKESFGENSDILNSVEEDTLPASLDISLKDLSYSKEIAGMLEGREEIEKIDYHYDLINKMINIERGVKYIGYAIVFVLFLVSVVIIHNTVKIGVSNRQREINIMKYVGASDLYIRSPFLIEGIIFGILGALIAFAIVYNVYCYYYGRVDGFIQNYGINLLDPKSIYQNVSVIFLCIGIGVGYLGSLLSTGRFLDV